MWLQVGDNDLRSLEGHFQKAHIIFQTDTTLREGFSSIAKPIHIIKFLRIVSELMIAFIRNISSGFAFPKKIFQVKGRVVCEGSCDRLN